MKKHILSSVSICSLFLLIFTSCSGPASHEPQKTTPELKTDTTRKDTTRAQAYVCPMGPQCGQADTAGKCPSCGMEMKPNPDFKKK